MTDADATRDTPPEETSRYSPLEHAIIENDTAPDECLIVPRDATERELETRWIVVSEGGYVPVGSMR